MFCPKCGSNVPDSVKFCPTCGEVISAEPQQREEPAAQPQQPVYQPSPAAGTDVMKVSEFFWTDFLLAIPLVGLILALVWGFSSDVNQNKRNYCRAKLIWILVGIGITVLLTIIAAVAGVGLLSSLRYMSY